MLEVYIEKLKPFVLELFEGDSSGHDIGHLERSMKLAIYISKREGGDEVITGIAAFLHDIHRIMQNQTGEFVHPKDSLSTVRKILSNIDLNEEQVKAICFAIENHEEYNWNGNNVEDLNTLILQDADNLEAIGAIGIGRAFCYGGAHNLPMYDSDIPLNESDDYEEAGGDNESTLHHFYHKLLKLEKNMNTKTGKALAKDRTDFMRDFANRFFEEWDMKDE